MSADSLDNFDYERASEHTSETQRRHYWAVAIGLQDVDGLSVSDYLRENANAYIEGEKTLAEVGSLVRSYHEAGNDAVVLGLKDNALVREELVCHRLFEDPSLLRNVDPVEALTLKSTQ
ncbi:MAG: hypothetical protein IJ111_04410 [Eggerthellaceae bacterium]|nr:hypothetical protein [Eggerthellaceae bacterium]